MRTVATKHGKYQHDLYALYNSMMNRCYRESNPGYELYGKRGISVCKEWRDGFEYFYTWAIENGWSKGTEIDRRNNDGDYVPHNCRFVSHGVNMQNSRYAKRWVVQGMVYRSLSDASRRLCVSASTVRLWCDGGRNNGKNVKARELCYSYRVYPNA